MPHSTLQPQTQVLSHPLKVVHIATTDIGGGAAIASYRLHQGLVRLGVDSQILVAQKFTDDARVHGANTLFEKLWSRTAHQIDQIPRRFLTTPNPSLISPAWIGDAVVPAQATHRCPHRFWCGRRRCAVPDLVHA
jgi:hypothetical protein